MKTLIHGMLGTVLALALVLQAALAGEAFAASSPQACIEGISAAMKAGDADGFEALVDVDALAAQGLAELEKASRDPHVSQWIPPVVSLMASKGALTSAAVQPFMVREIRNFVLYGVGSGAFGGAPATGYKSASMLGPLFAMVSMGEKSIGAPGASEPMDGGRMLVRFTVHDDNGSDYPVQGIFAEAAGGAGWRLVALNNFPELILQISMEVQD